jgi:hypothetical protein
MPLTVTIDNSRSGTSVTLSATTKDRNGTTISGTTRTYQRRYYGQDWQNTTTTFDISESYAVRVTASKTNYVTTTSAVDTKYVSQTVAQGANNANATRTYSNSGALRVETAFPTRDTTRLYHGNWTSGSQGDQKSAIWFEVPWGRINNAHAVTDLKVRLKRGNDSGDVNNSVFMIGTHTDSTVRNNWNDIVGKTPGRTSVTLDRSQEATVSLNGLNIDTTTLKGIVIGPAPDNNNNGSPDDNAVYYGWLYGNTNTADQPYLVVTYQADPHK